MAKYASYLTDKHPNGYDPEKVRLPSQGLAMSNQDRIDDNYLVARPAKLIYQASIKQSFQQRLATIQEMTKAPKDLDDNPNPFMADFRLQAPIRQYITCMPRQLQIPKILAGIKEHPTTIMEEIYEPEFDSHIESEFKSTYPALPEEEEDEEDDDDDDDDPGPDDEEYGSKLSDRLESTKNTLTAILDNFAPLCKRNATKYSKIVITYFLIFCVVGFLYALSL